MTFQFTYLDYLFGTFNYNEALPMPSFSKPQQVHQKKFFGKAAVLC